MSKFLAVFFGAFIALFITSCNREDAPGRIPLRDYSEQYTKDLADIEEFLKTHSYTVVDNPGQPDDQNVTFTKIDPTDETTPAIWDSPLLEFRTVALHDIEYKLYFLKLREGGGAANDKPYPCNVDAVLTSYSGRYMFRFPVTTVENGETVTVQELRTFEFETVPFPQNNLSLESVIKGWSEVFPQFRSGDIATVEGEPTQYNNFGAGVMFLPSGLGYYGASQSAIPPYSPLIFSFKLYEVQRLDQDQDGIPSYYEDLNGDRYIRILGIDEVNPDDSTADEDIVPDYLDLDDDGDNVLTKIEIADPVTGEPYPFEDIPVCPGGNGLKKHRDPSCQ